MSKLLVLVVLVVLMAGTAFILNAAYAKQPADETSMPGRGPTV